MTEKRTVKVDGVEFEVELTEKEDGSWDAVVEGKSFNIEVPVSYTHLTLPTILLV